MNFFETVYKIVSEIPTGKVISYGGVARLAGNPPKAKPLLNEPSFITTL